MNKFERAISEYDEAHERALAAAIITVIVESSMVDGVMVIRTGEIAAALTGVLAMTLALSPQATRTPRAIRDISEQVRKKITRQVHAAECDPATSDFLRRTFNFTDRDRGGNA